MSSTFQKFTSNLVMSNFTENLVIYLYESRMGTTYFLLLTSELLLLLKSILCVRLGACACACVRTCVCICICELHCIGKSVKTDRQMCQMYIHTYIHTDGRSGGRTDTVFISYFLLLLLKSILCVRLRVSVYVLVKYIV